MKAVIQRVSCASVTIEDKTVADIKQGFLILLGIMNNDSQDDINWLSKKIANLRIFGDDSGLMNKSIKDINGEAIVVSQFTLYASTKKGNRPGFIDAAKPDVAIPLYKSFISQLQIEIGKTVQTGKFGADMKVQLLNDGPITIIIDTKNKK